MLLCTKNLKNTLPRAWKCKKYENYNHLMFYFTILSLASLRVGCVKICSI